MKTTFTHNLVEVRTCFNFNKKQAEFLFNRSERTNNRHTRLFEALLADENVKDVEFDYHFGPHIWVTIYVSQNKPYDNTYDKLVDVITTILGEKNV